ncbi:MAG: aldehyde dehydrogenase, partial [Elusimicrobia bacterium]|nr:aldehyde dehydrogenase [Elusimicrobiota bacterium]
ALVNIVPTSTGAAKATTQVIEGIEGKFDGIAIRVPVIDVSLSDFVFLLKRKTTADEVNAAFKKAAESPRLKPFLQYTEVPMVSKDFTGNKSSAVFDATMTDVMGGTMVKVFAWYDNEWGYSNRVIDLAAFIASKLPVAAKA